MLSIKYYFKLRIINTPSSSNLAVNVTAGCISSLDDWQVLYNPRLHSNKLPLIAASVFQYFSLWKFAPPRYSSVWLHWCCHSPVKSGAISHSLFTNDMAVCQELSRAIKTPPSSSLIQTHRIIFPYLSDRLKRSRTFFIISPRVLKFCMNPPTHILNKIGGEQNLCQKVKYFSILNFVEKRVKNGKFWPKNGIPVFLAHKWR